MAKNWKVNYDINLSSEFDAAYSDKDYRLRSKLKPLLKETAVKRSIGSKIVDRIIERTSEEGIDKEGREFSSYAPYSKIYKQSLPFKVYGKTDKVTLRLSGEMLASMVARNKSNNVITITFIDQLSNSKAHGHVNGGGNLPKRDFLGLPKDELHAIIREVVNSYSVNQAVFDIDTLTAGLTIPFKTEFGESSQSVKLKVSNAN